MNKIAYFQIAFTIHQYKMLKKNKFYLRGCCWEQKL